MTDMYLGTVMGTKGVFNEPMQKCKISEKARLLFWTEENKNVKFLNLDMSILD